MLSITEDQAKEWLLERQQKYMSWGHDEEEAYSMAACDLQMQYEIDFSK